MKKSDESKRRSFFKGKPPKLFELSHSVSEKLFHTHPFRLLANQINKDCADLIVKNCGVTEKAIHEILVNSFEADSLFLELLGEDHEASDQGKKIVRQYSKAIDALESIMRNELSGTGIQESIKKDVGRLKKERADFARLHMVHPELKSEPISKTATGMFTNQAYNLFLYIKKCHEKTRYKAENIGIYELISELFIAIYDHPFFNAAERFTPEKIKEFCDNGPRQRKLRKTSLRKSLELL